MDISGNEGPKIKKVFTCVGCKWLGKGEGVYDNQKPSCFHPDIVSKYTDQEFILKTFMGTLNKDLSTPIFCPYLIKKLRYEKLKELNGWIS